MKPVMLPFATKFVREWRKINLIEKVILKCIR